MIEYGFVNSNGLVSYVNDGNLAFRGTWSSGSLYSPPVEAVDYNNGKFIVLVQNSGNPPLTSPSYWSELVVRGTISPTDPFEIAETAFETANAASVLALAAAGTATHALGLAQTAYNIATSGTVAGTNVPIPSGTNTIFVAGLNLGYTPSSVVLTVQMPNASGLNLFATLVGPPTSTGFIARLNGTTDASGYFLDWMARK